MSCLEVLSVGPRVQVQDLGRPGFHRYGVPEGGAMDRLACYELAALLSHPAETAVLEMAGFGGCFKIDAEQVAFALAGAPIRAKLNDQPLEMNRCYRASKGDRLDLAAVENGLYSYLGVKGGFQLPRVLNARSTHDRARIGGLHGRNLNTGDRLPLEEARQELVLKRILPIDRFAKDVIRIVWGPQHDMFPDSERQRFLNTRYTVDRRVNRMGARLSSADAPLQAEGHLSGVSDAVAEGDIQIPGDGYPAVLLADRQTTGGYPRIATVITADLPRMAQRAPGSPVRFELVDIGTAITALKEMHSAIHTLTSHLQPIVRNPADMTDLHEYDLTSGATADELLPWETKK